ncbi:MAG TPA: hypothetical protein VFR11_10370 [Micromonosporaceae bacterium]|nr:hypothetical protein [Micromonosporaceae bacterium]
MTAAGVSTWEGAPAVAVATVPVTANQRDAGRTVLLSSQILSEVEALGDRVTIGGQRRSCRASSPTGAEFPAR